MSGIYNIGHCVMTWLISNCEQGSGTCLFLQTQHQNVGRGLMLWLFVGPTGVYLLDFFCSGIQFNLLLSPYPCFISLLYLDLYVLGDDALIS